MKKMLTVLAVAAVVMSASADLTGFYFTGGKAYDNTDTAFTMGADLSMQVFLNVDLSAYVVENEINISDIPAAFTELAVAIGPVVAGGKYSTGQYAGDGSIAGSTAYGVLKIGSGAIEVGDWIAISSGFTVNELDPGGAPPAATQNFAAGDLTTNVQVIPEPATLGLMGVAGLGMFLARRKARR